MIKIVRKHQRKILTFIAVFAMISFAANFGSNPGRNQGDPIRGYMGETPLRASELERSRREWQTLMQTGTKTPFGPEIPIAFLLAPPQDVIAFLQIGQRPRIIYEIEQHPEMYLILQKEARDAGTRVTADSVESFLRNEVAWPSNVDKELEDRVRVSVANFILVTNFFERSIDNIKVSQPLLQFQLAQHFQTISLNLVEIPADEFKAKPTTAPTTQEIDTQFERYAQSEVDQPVPLTNPFGFGYKLPNRAKIQFIRISHDAVKKSIEAQKTPYEWEVEARRLFAKKPEDFPTTQSLSTTKPTTKPAFEEVKQQVIDKVIKPRVDLAMIDALNRIKASLAVDSTAWDAYKKALASTSGPMPTTAPGSSLGPAYDTFEYLQKLAAEIQDQTKVLPEVTSMGELKPVKDLKDLPGIGKARIVNENISTYVGGYGAAFMPEEERSKPHVLNLFAPSEVMTDDNGDLYIFRISEMRKAEIPGNKSIVMDQVLADMKKSTAYLSAKEAGTTLLDEARDGGLAKAATTAKRKVVSVGPFNNAPQATIPNFKIEDPAARGEFIQSAFQLLIEASRTKNPHPVSVIELPRENKVLVAELEKVSASWKPEEFYKVQLQQRFQMRQTLEQILRVDWFTWDSVVTRSAYRSDQPAKPGSPAGAS